MDKLRLETYTSIAETVSALAIVVTPAYAGYESRLSSTLISREVDVLVFDRIDDTNRMLAESPDLAEVVLAGRSDAVLPHPDAVATGPDQSASAGAV